MEELNEKTEQVLSAIATYSKGTPLALSAPNRHVLLKLRDGSQQSRELGADEWLGIGEDRDLLSQHLRLKGLDVATVEFPKTVANKDLVQWCATLSNAFVKAAMQKVDVQHLVGRACAVGERLIHMGRHDWAFAEVYSALSDRMLELKGRLVPKPGIPIPDDLDKAAVVSACVRFQLGRCMTLYQATIQRDEMLSRRDSVEVVRDVLRDIVLSVQLVHEQEAGARESLYWAVHNAGLLALRASRWLRLRGFGGVAPPALWWLVQSMAKCLPLVAVHALPFRMRLVEELVYSAESVQQFGEAARYCDVAVAQVEFAQSLETMLPPVPEESAQVFQTLLTRFRMLKIKYDFWLGKVPDAKTAWTQAEALGGPAVGVACLVEAVQVQHGLPRHFTSAEGATGWYGGAAEGVEAPEGGPDITRLSAEEVQRRQTDLIEHLVSAERLQSYFDKLQAATQSLEEYAKGRREFESQKERLACSDLGAGDDMEPQPPVPPDEEKLSALGFMSSRHSIEDVLPLAGHAMLAREALRIEMATEGATLPNAFKMLDRSLALRLRYRHFLCPPLVDIDVVQTPQRDREKVPLPDQFEFLTEDINLLAHRNRMGDTEEGRPPTPATRPRTPATGTTAGESHVYVIGQRYRAWESWTSEDVVPIRRICNLRIVFAAKRPTEHNLCGDPNVIGFFDAELSGANDRPWIGHYYGASAADSSCFDHVEETDRTVEALLRQLTVAGHLTQRIIALPIEAHPGAGKSAASKNDGEETLLPFLVFNTFEERALWKAAKDAEAEDEGELDATRQQTLLPSDVPDPAQSDAMVDDVDSEVLLPPWCSVLDDALASTTPILDLSIFVTKHLHAFVPSPRFNALVKADLRRTPRELLGRPLQTYIFMCAATNAPSVVSIVGQLRLLRALHSLHTAAIADAAEETADAPEDGSSTPGSSKRAVMSRLIETADCVERVSRGPCGRIFLLENADLVEDSGATVFLRYAWPRLRNIQDAWFRDEVGECVLSDREKARVSEWSSVLREVLPVLLRTLGDVQTVDAVTLGSATFALAKLSMRENEAQKAQAELGRAISRLEDELARPWVQGPQPGFDQPAGSMISFDPPALRSPNFAMFCEGGESRGESGDARKTSTPIVLRRLERLDQERLCLLMRLYEFWIDSCLKAHLKNVGSTIRRARRPNEIRAEDEHMPGGMDNDASKLTLSNQEAAVLARLGDNPYLRCMFFVAVGRRRPDVVAAALGKACREVEAAVTEETHLWEFLEQELTRQQDAIRAGEGFGNEFISRTKPKGTPLPAFPPAFYFRSPRLIRMRLPPLPDSVPPPAVASAADLHPDPQEYDHKVHSQMLGVLSPDNALLTCAVFGKPIGAGTTVSAQHTELRGTGVRRAGYSFVEVTDLRPNTTYSFASIFYEGFAAMRPAVSSVSDASPPIGSYYPLSIAMLRTEICKAALQCGRSGDAAWKTVWPLLLESFCEQTPHTESLDADGLRTLKLRLDVADRLPPAVLLSFAELLVLKNSKGPRLRHAKNPDTFEVARPLQQVVLRSANECIIAADCACRARNSHVTSRCMSLTMKLASRLLHYRTKPQLLLALLVKCVMILDSFEPEASTLAWHAQTRTMATYLLHHVCILSIQLREVALVPKHLEEDGRQHEGRYGTGGLVDARRQGIADHHVLDHALELALLGSTTWQFSEGKATVVLKDQAIAADAVRHLKELSDRNFAAVAKDALQIVIRQQEQKGAELEVDPKEQSCRSVNALSILRSAAARSWDGGAMEELLQEVQSKHLLVPILERILEDKRAECLSYGFMLRAPPPGRLSWPSPAGDQDQAVSPSGEPGVVESVAPDRPEAVAEEQVLDVAPMAALSRDGDSITLAYLELCRVAPLLKEMQGLTFHWHDISRFKFYDLEQMVERLPNLDADGSDLAGTDTILQDDEPADADVELEDWQQKEASDRMNRKRALELLKKSLGPLARAAAFASASHADQLLFSTLIASFNALLMAGPSPGDCVPPGDKSNPLDVQPDTYVGIQLDAAGEPQDGCTDESGSPAPPDNDMWLNLVVIAQLVVDSLAALKARETDSAKAKTRGAPRAPSREAEESGRAEEREEVEVIRVATEASRALEGADEELLDMWFESRPDLDIISAAKFVAFAALCLYHMRRWSSVVLLCRKFNDATCSVFATTFLKIAIGAQRQVCELSRNTIANTKRYLEEAEQECTSEHGKLTNKQRRQLKLLGEASEPQKRFQEQSKQYNQILKRQEKMTEAWACLLKTFEKAHSLATRAVPLAMEQLKKSRLLLADFLQDRQSFTLGVRRGQIKGGQRAARERALSFVAMALVSSYRKSIELLRKRQMADRVVQALHELGNLQWLEGDVVGARASWSDAVDAVFQYVDAIKSWRHCVETALLSPENSQRAELMLLAVVILEKHARLTNPNNLTAHLNAALFASAIIEAVLMSALPHPSKRMHFAADRYRMREIFFGLREANFLLLPNTVHGGVDGSTFLGSLAFFHRTFLSMGYQLEKCVPMCSLYNYIATDVCLNKPLMTRGRVMMARGLIHCRLLEAAWTTLFAIAKEHDMPRSLTVGELHDVSFAEVQELAAATPYDNSAEPFTERNMQAVDQLCEFTFPRESDADVAAMGAFNMQVFNFLQAEFMVVVCSRTRVFTKLGDAEEVCRTKWLDRADTRLLKLWKEITGNEDDLDSWFATVTAAQQAQSRPSSAAGDTMPTVAPLAPQHQLGEEDGALCVDIRLLRAWISELRGDLGRAVREVLYAMRVLQLQASGGTQVSQECGVGSGGAEAKLRKHPDAKAWMQLRRRMVHLLVAQGRLTAAEAHIEQGIQECGSSHDEVTLIELLAARVEVNVLGGKLLEVHGQRKVGAVPTAERCLAVASKNLTVPTVSAVKARLMLSLLTEQNPSLVQVEAPEKALPTVSEKSPETASSLGKDDPYEQLLLEAAGAIIVSPLSRSVQSRKKTEKDDRPHRPPSDVHRESLIRVAEQVSLCVHDLDSLLEGQGFQLLPGDMNALFNFANAENSDESLQPPLFPPSKNRLREQLPNDSRTPPNLYLDLMPLQLHCELILARLRLDLGELKVVQELLQAAEARSARCAYLLPWLYVEFCVLKLQWRRYCHEKGQALIASALDAPNSEKYSDPLTFVGGLCPPTDSPLFRTFVRKAPMPTMTHDSVWRPRPLSAEEDGLEQYLQELVGVLQVCVREGGHDYEHLFSIVREGLEEVVRVKGGNLVSPMEKMAYDQVYTFLSCLLAIVEARKALLFEPSAPASTTEEPVKGSNPKGGSTAGGPAPIDVGLLPNRVFLDIQQHLRRQEKEGALAYSAAAQQEKAMPFRTIVRHAHGLRRKCELFANIHHSVRLTCDQLHVALMDASEAYSRAKVLSSASIESLLATLEAPATGDLLIAWVKPSPHCTGQPANAFGAFVLFVCPLLGSTEEDLGPFLARCSRVCRSSLRKLFDGLASDLEHCHPADAVAAEHVARRLRETVCVLRGELLPEVAAARLDVDAETAIQRLLARLGSGEDVAGSGPLPGDSTIADLVPEDLGAERIRELFRALLRLFDKTSAAARVVHRELGYFFREVLVPLGAPDARKRA